MQVCQVATKDSKVTYNCGDESSVAFDYTNSILYMKFTGTQGYLYQIKIRKFKKIIFIILII